MVWAAPKRIAQAMQHSQPYALALPVMGSILALLIGGLVYSGAPILGILLLALPVAAVGAFWGLKAAIREMGS